MFKIYILSILCTFSLMAMEKTQPKNLSSQHRDDLKALQQPYTCISPFNTSQNTGKEINANPKGNNTNISRVPTLRHISKNEREAIKIAYDMIRNHSNSDLDEDKIKSFKDAIALIKEDNVITSMLEEAIGKERRLLIPILIDKGARSNIQAIETIITCPEYHDILTMLIKNPVINNHVINKHQGDIFNTAINYELVDVIANFIHVQKWQFTKDNLNQAIDKASSQKSSYIAILLLQNLSHLHERLNKDQAAKYINFIINSDSPESIDYILLHYRQNKIDIYITDEITNSFMDIKNSAEATDEMKIKFAHDKNFQVQIYKGFVAMILSLQKLLKNDNVDDFKYIYSLLLVMPSNFQDINEFKNLLKEARSSPNQNFIFLLTAPPLNLNNYRSRSLANKDPFAGEKITSAKFVGDIDEISPPPIAPKKLEKNLCAIFYNLNEPLAEYLHGYRIKCQYKENKVTIAINPMNDKILNIIYNIITKHRFSSIKDGHKIIINISSKDISDDMLKTLNHDLSDSVTKYIKKQKIIISRDDSISKGDNYSEEYHGSEIIPSNTTPKNPYKKLYNKKNITTSWDDFTKEAKGAKNTKEDHQQKNNKSKQNNNKSCPEKTPNKSIKHDNKNPKNSKKTVLPQQLSPLTDRNNTKKPYNKFNNDYHLTNNKEINPLSYKSPFLSDDNDNDIIIPNKDIKNSPNNLSITLLSNYYNFFKRISDDNIKEIFNHGIMAIDFSKMKHKTYINNINDGLKNFNNDIIPELNNIYNKFKEKYDIYLTENNDARIVEINHLLVWLQEEYQDLIANEDAAKGYLFILGEHLSRLFNNNQEEAINIIGDYYLLMRMKDFRNATKHSGDNKITTKEATYVIGEEPIAGYNSLLKDLYDKISQNPDKI